MPLKIAILEDNADRTLAMCALLRERFPDYEVCCFTAAQQMIDWLRTNLAETQVISLDHDLEVVVDEAGHASDPGTGREVANYLATQTPKCRVIIHSTNVPAAIGMECELQEAGWNTFRLTPYDDLEWIGREWFDAIAVSQATSNEVVEDEERRMRRVAFQRFAKTCRESKINSGGLKLTRDELHERH